MIIHGREDSLVALSGGEATARAVPGADLLVLGQMGHDLPEVYLPQIADAIFGVAVRGRPTDAERCLRQTPHCSLAPQCAI